VRRSVNVRVVQHRPTLGDLEANLTDHRARIEAAAEDGVDVVHFTELSLTGYALGDLVDAVALDSDHSLWPEVCALSESVDVVLGFVERGADGFFYNAAGYFHAGRPIQSLIHN
jgi:predicted amidohydrolase